MVEQGGPGMGMAHDELGAWESSRLSFLTDGYVKSKRKFRKVFRRRSYIGNFGASANRFTDRTRTSRDTLPTVSDSTMARAARPPAPDPVRENRAIKASSFHEASSSHLHLNAHYDTRKTTSFHASTFIPNGNDAAFQSSSFPLPDTPINRHRRQESGGSPTTSTQRRANTHSASLPTANSIPSSRGGNEEQASGLFRGDSYRRSSTSSRIPDEYPVENANVPNLDSYYQPVRLKISPNVTDDAYEGQTVHPEPPNSRMRLCDLVSTGKYVNIGEEIDTSIRVHDGYVSFIVPVGWTASRTAWGFYLFCGDFLGFICAAASKNATAMLLNTQTVDRLSIFSKVRVLSSPVFESTHSAVVNYIAHDLKGRGIAQYTAGFASGAVVFALCAPQDDADKLAQVEDYIAGNAVVIQPPPIESKLLPYEEYNHYSGTVGKQVTTSSIVWNKISNVLKRR